LAEEAWSLLTAEPVEPFAASMPANKRTLGDLPLFFIETLQDRVAPLELERAMQRTAQFKRVFSLDTGHSSFSPPRTISQNA
jgi:hypothetical protein